MLLFGLINYEDYVLKAIMTSSYARNVLTVSLMYLITGVIRFHLSILLCWLFTWDNIIPENMKDYLDIMGPFFDFLFPVLVGVILALMSDVTYRYVNTHRMSYERLVDYIMANYNRENIIVWKRIVLIGICCYIFLATLTVTIDNSLIFVSTVQTAIAFVICDLIEHRNLVSEKLSNIFFKPNVTRLTEEFSLINSYVKEAEDNSFYRLSPPLLPKPPTPPRIHEPKPIRKRMGSSIY